ncbi:MAG: hypothetical protein WCF18_18890 [Chthoniobacteraceae bacterium]
MGRRWRCLAVAGWALLLSACSSFEREWKRAPGRSAAKPAAAKADPFGGAWDGGWTSEKHRLPSGPAGGRLRCIFTHLDDAHYRARFHADWLCFATGYEVTFETRRRGDVLIFRGDQDLGAIFGGIYRYDGRVTPTHFSASFASRYDYGRFEMTRPTR